MQSAQRKRMATGTGAGKVVRKVRKRLAISQEALSRLLNTTKGAVQHWERGRNNPDLARLLALRRFCPLGPERRGLDELLERIQALVTPAGVPKPEGLARLAHDPRRGAPIGSPEQSADRREHLRLERQIERLKQRVSEGMQRIRALESLVDELRRMSQPGHSVAPRALGWTAKEPD